MIAILQTFLFQIFSILVFAFLYDKYLNEFTRNVQDPSKDKKKNTYLDALYMSVTIQCGVGYSELYPYTQRSKILVIMQQILMISANVLILYLFSLHLLKRR